MEPVHEAHKASKLGSEYVISSMPDNVITNILDRLPVEDAVATGILSRSWRYKYTMLTQLVYDGEFDGEYWYDETDISRLLLDLKGPITKFVLSIPKYKILNVKDINHWIMFLSKKGIKEFTLINMNQTPIKMPTHLYSCVELKHLKLRKSSFHLAPSFRGFPNLLSLVLHRVTFESGNCGEFITQCPLLEILIISYYGSIGKLKLADIAKLENLNTLSLPLSKLEDITITSSSIFQIGSYLPKLQELCLDIRNYNFIGEAGARKWVCNAFFGLKTRNAFFGLKTLTLYAINFSNGNMVSWAFEIIWGCPILQTLNITAIHTNSAPVPAILSLVADYNTMGQLQIRNVVFSSCRGSENEVCLIKYLLACSPLLKQFVVRFDASLVSDEKLMFAMKLLKLHRVFGAEVVLY